MEFGITISSDGEWISRRSLRHGDEGRERLLEVVVAFLDDPTASLARSKDHCCLCRKLTDGTSVLRGYWPECAKKIGTLLSYFTGEPDGNLAGKDPILDFDSLLSLPVEPDEDHKDDEFGSGLDEDDESILVPSNKHSGHVDAKLECHDPESEVEKTDPFDDYFDPEAGIWWVESHRGQVCIGLPWTAETPLDVVLDDAVATISGCIEDGLTDDDDNPITDYRSLVLWKGPDVATVATEAGNDPSRLEFTYFRS